MNRTVSTFVAMALGCLCVLFLSLADFVRSQKGVGQREAQRSREMLDAQLTQARTMAGGIGIYTSIQLIKEVRQIRIDLRNRLVSLERTADKRLGAIQGDARDQIRVAVKKLDSRAREASGAVVATSLDLRATLNETKLLAAASTRTVNELRPQISGAFAAVKMAAGDMATMSRDTRKAFPQVLVTWEQIGQNSNKTTAMTAQTMANLEQATRPLPKYIRYPFKIGATVGPIVVTGITAAAAAGAFK